MSNNNNAYETLISIDRGKSALNLIKEMMEQNTYDAMLKDIGYVADTSQFTFTSTADLIDDIYSVVQEQPTVIKFDRITQLKSQLKHCKNHMQRLNIEMELNKLYKNKEKN